MCLIHDLGEAFTGDIPTFRKSDEDTVIEDGLFLKWVGSFPEAQRSEQNLRPYLDNIEGLSKMGLHGETMNYAACDTWQIKDYSRYDMGFFNEEAKLKHREEQFPKDLEAAFKMGEELGK